MAQTLASVAARAAVSKSISKELDIELAASRVSDLWVRLMFLASSVRNSGITRELLEVKRENDFWHITRVLSDGGESKHQTAIIRSINLDAYVEAVHLLIDSIILLPELCQKQKDNSTKCRSGYVGVSDRSIARLFQWCDKKICRDMSFAGSESSTSESRWITMAAVEELIKPLLNDAKWVAVSSSETKNLITEARSLVEIHPKKAEWSGVGRWLEQGQDVAQ